MSGSAVASAAAVSSAACASSSVGLLDQRADPVGLAALEAGAADALHDLVAARIRHRDRHDRRAPGRQLVDHRHVEVGVGGHRERPRDRRRRHDQLVRVAARRALLAQRRRWCTPKRCCSSTITSASRAKRDALLEQRVRADHELRLPPSAIADLRVAARARRAADPSAAAARCRAARASARNSARCCSASSSVGAISAAWRPASTASRRRERRDDRLAGADVALHQAQHRVRDREVGADLARSRAAARRSARSHVPASRRSASSPRRARSARRDRGGSRSAAARSAQLVREQLLEGEPALRRMAAGLEQRRAPRPAAADARTASASRSVGSFSSRWMSAGSQSGSSPSPTAASACAVRFRSRPAGCPRSPDRSASARPAPPACPAHRRACTRDARSRARACRAALRRSSAAACRARSCCCWAPLKWKNRSVRNPRAVGEAHEQRAPAAEHDFGELDRALDCGASPGAQRADRHDARAVLVTRRQQEEQIRDGLDAELREPLRERRTDALEPGDRRGVRWSRHQDAVDLDRGAARQRRDADRRRAPDKAR